MIDLNAYFLRRESLLGEARWYNSYESMIDVSTNLSIRALQSTQNQFHQFFSSYSLDKSRDVSKLILTVKSKLRINGL